MRLRASIEVVLSKLKIYGGHRILDAKAEISRCEGEIFRCEGEIFCYEGGAHRWEGMEPRIERNSPQGAQIEMLGLKGLEDWHRDIQSQTCLGNVHSVVL